MSFELDLLIILGNKDNYNKYIKYIDKDSLSKEIAFIIKSLPKYQDIFGTVTSWKDYSSWLLSTDTTISEDFKPLIIACVDRLEGYSTLPLPSTENVLKRFIERYTAELITGVAYDIATGKTGTIENITTIIEDHKAKVSRLTEDEDIIVTDDVEEIIRVHTSTKGYSWRLKELNEAIGPLCLGDLIVISARPDSGKTTMLASEATFMAPQLDTKKVILWFNNEESRWKVRYRHIQAALGWDTTKIEADPVKTRDEYYKAIGGKGKIVLIDDSAMTVRMLERTINQFDPGLIIIDQLFKVHGGSKESTETEQFRQVAEWARRMAKTKAPVIITNQADGSAENVPYPDMSQLYGSKTGLQGEADVIMIIGRVHSEGNIRHINIPKSKSLRVGTGDKKFPVLLIPEIARYEST